MRRFPAIAATLFALVCISGVAMPARAEAGPVCLAGGSANALQCDYATLAQCQATAAGGLGYCVTNPHAVTAYASYGRRGQQTH